MHSLAPLLLCAILLPAPPQDGQPNFGHLWQPEFAVDLLRRAPSSRYEPQPGDLLLLNAGERLFRASYYLTGSGPPTHSGLVFRLPDGSLGFLEGGIGLQLAVEISPLAQRLPEYFGDIYVRRRRQPLTKEESEKLTAFALAVHKQRITIVRFPLQVTPFRTRGPVRTEFLGKPRGIGNHTWTCSELVVEACIAVGILDADTARPAATYPRDFFFDYSRNPYLNRHLSPQVAATWHTPARWTPAGE